MTEDQLRTDDESELALSIVINAITGNPIEKVDAATLFLTLTAYNDENAATILMAMRRMSGLSQQELADVAKVSPTTVRKYEKGETKLSQRPFRAIQMALCNSIFDQNPTGFGEVRNNRTVEKFDIEQSETKSFEELSDVPSDVSQTKPVTWKLGIKPRSHRAIFRFHEVKPEDLHSVLLWFTKHRVLLAQRKISWRSTIDQGVLDEIVGESEIGINSEKFITQFEALQKKGTLPEISTEVGEAATAKIRLAKVAKKLYDDVEKEYSLLFDQGISFFISMGWITKYIEFGGKMEWTPEEMSLHLNTKVEELAERLSNLSNKFRASTIDPMNINTSPMGLIDTRYPLPNYLSPTSNSALRKTLVIDKENQKGTDLVSN